MLKGQNKPDYRGGIVLEAHRASIHHSSRGSCLRIDPIGAVGGWSNKRTWLSWDFKADRSGRFDLSLISSTDRDGRWEGGHRVKVSVSGEVLTGAVRKGRTAANPRAATGWKDVISHLGRISISKPGKHRLSLKPERLERKKGLSLTLRAIQLIPVS